MNLRLPLSLALASLWHRRGILTLVTLTLTLSVTLLLGVQYLRSEVRHSFTSAISGTDLIVGARSGQLNLLLYSVFHLGNATNNIHWSSYQTLRDMGTVDWAVPLSLGDSYRGYRVVGTDEGFLKHYRYGNDRPLQLAAGAWFDDVFDVVLGASVARELRHRLDDQVILAHGGGATSFLKHDQTPFRVSGILAPTGTPVDRAVYVSLQGLEAIHTGWEAGVPRPGRTLSADQARQQDLTPQAITAALVGVERKVLTFRLQRRLNEFADEPLSAILPGVALSELWRIMGQFETALLGITGFVVVTSLVGLAAVLLTLQVHRKQEIAILRATGASPTLIALLYILECAALAILACLLAVLLGGLLIAVAGPWLLHHYGLHLQLRPLDVTEWLILACVPLAAVLVGLIPAARAWWRSRTQHFGTTSTE
ncbi:MAG: ABC transporter permease [Marinobacter sp.]|uniref:ABC transporter permease n=1 Tax=Marinobacter sp. TaxID=50741 RepID=UPI00299D86BE|nr:ABC transporter permease [Marinobacter sp.]MDX1756850.1 ABC transporter permease [Marinobacter sp.]